MLFSRQGKVWGRRGAVRGAFRSVDEPSDGEGWKPLFVLAAHLSKPQKKNAGAPFEAALRPRLRISSLALGTDAQATKKKKQDER